MTDQKKTVEDYIAALPPNQQEIVAELRRIIKIAAPILKETLKWAQPVYEVNGPVIYIKAYKAQVNFGFWRGTQLNDTHGLLTGDGDRMKHIKLQTVSDILEEPFVEFIQEAVKLNQKLGDPSKGKL